MEVADRLRPSILTRRVLPVHAIKLWAILMSHVLTLLPIILLLLKPTLCINATQVGRCRGLALLILTIDETLLKPLLLEPSLHRFRRLT